jgi:prepilin-type N-terminal cleavage/methylation domain-containing protein
MTLLRSRGFTLVELAAAMLVLGLLFAFSVPAFQSVSASYQLKGATQNIAAQLRLAREKAIATGTDQPMHFTYQWAGCNNCDYHIHYPSGVGATWNLPRGVTYYSVGVSPTMLKDGRANASGDIILQNQRGARDTVSVQMSGLILTR